MMFLLDSLSRQNLSQLFLPIFLKQFINEFLIWRVMVKGETEYWTGQGATESLGPPESLLFDHLKQSFRVYWTNFDLRLKTAYLVGPGHWFAWKSIGSEFHQTFVDGIKEALVLDVNRLPHHLRLLGHILAATLEHSFFPCFLYFQVQINRDDRVLLKILGRLKVPIRANFRSLQILQNADGRFLDWLRELFEELDVVVVTCTVPVRVSHNCSFHLLRW